jgi:hypothetical protein
MHFTEVKSTKETIISEIIIKGNIDGIITVASKLNDSLIADEICSEKNKDKKNTKHRNKTENAPLKRALIRPDVFF